MISSKNKKCGTVAIVGTPNTGKSTLLNQILGTKISIVSPKAQTTRNRITGIHIEDESQIIFVDTPGLFRPRGKLKNTLNSSIVGAAKNVIEENMDFIALVIDAKKGFSKDNIITAELIEKTSARKILVINKIDLVKKENLLEIAKSINEQFSFEETFFISAKKNDGVIDFVKYLAKNIPENIWLYPEDQISNMPERFFASEITREKLFYSLDEEMPYNLMVETEKFEERKRDIKIHQVIYTNSESQKKIIIGKNGSIIKQVGEKSRKELSHIFEKEIHLFLFVKVRQNWMKKFENFISY